MIHYLDKYFRQSSVYATARYGLKVSMKLTTTANARVSQAFALSSS